LAFSPDCKLIAIGYLYDQHPLLEIWNLSSKRRIADVEGHKPSVDAVVFSLDSRYVVSGDYEGLIIIWDTKQQRRIRKLQAHKGAVTHLLFTPDGKRFVSSSIDGTVKLWAFSELLKTKLP